MTLKFVKVIKEAQKQQALSKPSSEPQPQPDANPKGKQGTPSNKPKTPAKQEATGEKGAPPPPPAAAQELAPFIDKLSITLTIPAEDLGDVHSAVYTAFNDTAVFQSAGKNLKGFKATRNIAIPGNDARVHFAFKSKDSDPPHARLEFNPEKLGPEGMMGLDAVLTSIMPDGWEYVVKHGRITRMDVAVDIVDARMHQFLLLPAQGLTVISVHNAKGKLKSLYIGKKEGNQTVLYSKSAQQASKKIFMPAPTVRLERRLRNLKAPSLAELGGMENPFKTLKLITTMPPAPEAGQDWVWQLFLDAVVVRGLPQALALLVEKRRTAYRKHLAQHQVGWWDPAAVWKHWPSALAILGIAG